MHLATLDWIIIGLYFAITIAVGLAFSHAAGKGVEDFFLAGRKLTWWMAGGSMVATMFASDTPLFHCGNVRDMGLSAGWLFILPMFGALAACALFARLVRRTGVVTDAEFIELRYSGNAPAPFRAFMAVYSGIIVASLTMGWVTKGMIEVISQTTNWPEVPATIALLAIVVVYSMASGMWGVVMTDMFQYIVAAGGSLFIAIVAVHACGGLEGLRNGLAAIPGYSGADLHWLPNGKEFIYSQKGNPVNMIFMTWPLLIAWFIINNIGQASSTAHQGQRILACKTERDASLTYIFYSMCYFGLNGLSWFVVGLASVLVLGATNQEAGLANSQRAFPAMINTLMPIGLKGLMIASIFAAFMSTVSVLLNWGSSYVVNDLYRRFLVTNASQKHYVWISRLACLGVAVLGGLFSISSKSLSDIFSMVPMLLQGAVVVLIARYLWWRTNIWSEISAMVISPIVGFYIEFVVGGRGQHAIFKHLPGSNYWYSENPWVFFGQKLMTTVAISTTLWLFVTLLTKPTEIEKLKSFYIKVRPTGPGWAHVRKQIENPPSVESAWMQLGVWMASIAFILGAITTVIEVIKGENAFAALWLVFTVVGGYFTNRWLSDLDKQSIAGSDSADVYEANRLAGLVPEGQPADLA
ncbi:MAG: sodium:solute symporter family protein [Armatimonadota bacterium]